MMTMVVQQLASFLCARLIVIDDDVDDYDAADVDDDDDEDEQEEEEEDEDDDDDDGCTAACKLFMRPPNRD